MLTRRQFVKAALAAGAVSAVPPVLESFLQSARAGIGTPTSGFFLTTQQWATCAALCSRIVPTGSDATTDPGATEAKAVVFIDRFMSAFDAKLVSVADGPAIYLRGNFSGRNPFPTGQGTASTNYPSDDFLDSSGVAHFLGLTPAQTLSWKYQLYGASALAAVPANQKKWASQVIAGIIPSSTPAAGLRQAYIDGLAAFDSWSRSMFATPYSGASTGEQDLMLQLAGNVVLNAVTGNVPLPWPSPPTPPPAASALFPIITLHTFQATYGLPEYSWRHDAKEWDALGYDGDTMPLGNSIYDPNMTFADGEDPNVGYGDGVYSFTGGYREYRPVSTPDPGSTPIRASDAATLEQAIHHVRGQSQ
jgi:hypothetical protein